MVTLIEFGRIRYCCCNSTTIITEYSNINNNVNGLYFIHFFFFCVHICLTESLPTNNNAINPRCYISALLILRYLERISDHACHIGDSVRYIVTLSTLSFLFNKIHQLFASKAYCKIRHRLL